MVPGKIQGVAETEQCYTLMTCQQLRVQSLLWARGQSETGTLAHPKSLRPCTNLEAVLGPSRVSMGPADSVVSASLT